MAIVKSVIKNVSEKQRVFGRLTRRGFIKFERQAGHITSKPARHLRTVVNHMINFFGILSNEWAGAQAFSSVDTLLAPYVYKIYKDMYKRLREMDVPEETARSIAEATMLRETEQSVQEFLFHVNYPTRYGSQSPFVNITLDLKVPHDLVHQRVLIAGEELTDEHGKPLTYGDLQYYVDIFNKAFFRAYIKGDGQGRVFTFPIVTINLTEYFFNGLDEEVRDLVLEANVKFGATYFQNCINGYMNGRKLDEGDSRAMCCLHPDTLVSVLFDGEDEPQVLPISLLIDTDIEENPSYRVLTPWGYIRPKKAFRIKFSGEMIHLKIYNYIRKVNIDLIITPDHLQPLFYLDEGNVKRVIVEAGLINQKRDYYLDCECSLFPIKQIRRIQYSGYVFDFEMPEGKELFYANGVLTHNCRLQIDVKEMLAYSKGLFSAGDYVGSVGVVTLNMAALGYLAKGDKAALFKLLEKWIDIAAESLVRKKKAVTEYLKMGLYPYTWTYLPYKQFESHFLTIGYCGLHEGLLNFGIEDGIVSDEGVSLAQEILQFMSRKIDELKDKYDMLFNLEATPAEGASYRLAKAIKKVFPDIITSGTDTIPYLTNSCHPPADMQGDYVFLTKHQDKLQPLHSGGTVVHYYVGKKLDKETLYNLLKLLGYNTRLPYFTITPVISVCPVHGTLPGSYDFCPFEHSEEELEKYGVEVNGTRQIKCDVQTADSCCS